MSLISTLCFQRFFLHAAYWHYLAFQRDFTSHSNVFFRTLISASAETAAVAIVIPAEGPSLGMAALGA